MTDRYVLHDWLGSARGTEDATSTTTYPNAYLYDGYGRELNGTGTTTTNGRYGGAWGYQSEVGTEDGFGTGLIYTQQRYYDPETGGFISPDPIGFAGGLNLYAYCGEDPIGCVDPNGLRGLNGTDHARIEKIRNFTDNGKDAGVPTPSQLDRAANELESLISGLPSDPGKDPVNYKALWWAIDELGEKVWGKDSSIGKDGTGPVGKTWKCNAFVARAYGNGAGIGFSADGKGGKYPLYSGGNWPYQANDLAKESDFGSFDFIEHGPQPGDIVAWATNDGSLGHSSLYVGTNVVIYAGKNRAQLGTMTNQNGYAWHSGRAIHHYSH